VSGSLARQIVSTTHRLLVGSLLAVGLMTALLLHTHHRKALDRTLLAAAHGKAHPPVDAPWEVENSRAPVEVHVELPTDSSLPAEWVEEALLLEEPRFHVQGRQRMVVLVAETLLLPGQEPSAPAISVAYPLDRIVHESIEQHFLVVARAPRVTLAASVGPFASVYLLVALMVAGGAGGLQRRLVRIALEPLETARREAAAAGSHRGARLSERGPEETASFLHAMNDLLDRLDQASRAQARFTAHAAHELRTPVAVMLAEVELALRRPREPDEYRDTLASIGEEVGHLRDLVEGLTRLARLDEGGGESAALADVRDLIEAAADRERAGLHAAGCALRVTMEGSLGRVSGHGALLEAALANLLRNSALYAAGSAVELSATATPDNVTILVDDAGPGVAEEDREAVFDRLVRGGGARRRHPSGLGLGLPFAREVARRLGGDCAIEGGPAGGCRARLTLPRRLPD